jgi:hypothetical protein
MAVGTYQLPSPRAIDPPAGEFQLAGRSSNPDAFLLRFMGQRDLAQDDYGRELAAQHAFAVQQMMANINNEQQARGIDLAKLPGGGGVLASPGNALGASLSSDPGVLTNLAVAGDTAQGAKNFQATMTGLNQGSQGGFQPAPGSPLPPGIPAGMSFTNLGPALVQKGIIDAAARRDAATISAGGKGPSYSESYQYPPIPIAGGGELVTSGSATKLRTDADAQAARARATARAEEILRNRSGNGATGLTPNPVLPPAQQDTGVLTGDDTPLGTVTRAPGVANGPGTGTQTAPAAAKPPVGEQVIDTNSPLGKAAQTQAMKYLDIVQRKAAAGDQTAATALADIRAGMTGAAFPIVLKPDGGVYIKGTQPGHDYLLGQPVPGKK